MTTTFEETLAKINGQASVLGNLDERAVELGVILPLLKQLGWDTADLTQIYPQKPVTGGGRVDYDLQIDRVSRIFIEVKRWGHPLNDEDEGQLRDYCLAGKPSLAALTNGRQWQLYLPPLQRNPRELRQFLTFDITDGSNESEAHFSRFLAHRKMLTKSAVRQTVADAGSLFRDQINRAAVMKGLSEALTELATDNNVLAPIVTKLAENYGVQPTEEQVKEFLSATGILVKAPVVDKPSGKKQVQKHIKPKSFTLHIEGEAQVVKPAKHWNPLLLGVCLLMLERHPDEFSRELLEMPKWFSKYKESFRYSQPIADTGLHARWGGSSEIRAICPEIVSKFGYPPESLTIQEK